MRLYSLTGAAAVKDGVTVYEPTPDGGFDLPGEVAEFLRSSAVAGVKQWETDIERQYRLVTEEMERRKDPATLLSAVEQIVAAAQVVNAPKAAPPPAAKPAAKPAVK